MSVATFPGQTVSHYRLLERLGAGGMGVVYRAEDTSLGRSAALKFLLPELTSDGEAKERFLVEARAAARLDHPNICTVYEAGESEEGQLFIAMAFYEGETLDHRIARGPLSEKEAVEIVTQVARGLGVAHSAGIIHRDIKPGNVIVTSSGISKILDFGLAKRSELSITRSRTVGTTAYMAPEQIRGEKVTPATDVWSLGILLFELLTGQRPFRGDYEQAAMYAVLNDDPPRLRDLRPDISQPLEEIVERMLRKDPQCRFESMVELLLDLEAFTPAEREPDKASVSSVPLPSDRKPGSRAASSSPRRRTVAVLPFLNMSADPENAYFADGITEDLLTELSKVATLKVVSRTSAGQFRNREQNMREIGRALHADVIIEGSVRKAGDRVRISARVVNAETDEEVWSDSYDRFLTDVFAIQREVALQVTAALSPELSSAERAVVGKAATNDVEAYQFYLQGKHCLARITEEGLRKAVGFFELAAERDPSYAQPHSQIAFAYMCLGMGHGEGRMQQREAQARARLAIDRALALDPQLAEAHSVEACFKFMFDFDWQGAERAFRRALELARDSAQTLGSYGLYLSSLRRFDDALRVQRQAHELEPLLPVQMSDIASTLLRAGRYDEALEQARGLLELEPGFPTGLSTKGWALIKKGEFDEGLRELEAAVKVTPGNTMFIAQLGEAYGVAGQMDKAREVLDKLTALSHERYVSPYHLAYVHTGMRDYEKAIDCLEQAVEERAGSVYGVYGSFLFNELHENPRFVALLKRMRIVS